MPRAARILMGFAALLVAATPPSGSPLAQAGRTAPQSAAQPSLPTTRLNIGLHLVTAELAADPTSRQLGLMFRQSLAPNHGMLFDFDYRAIQCMWMRNTFIPLSVAFFDDDGRIVNIEDMQPKDETTRHCSRRPVRFALEMTQGWFAQRKLGAGDQVRGLPAPR